MSNDLGYPDIGLTTLEDVSDRSKKIARVTNLPTIADIDTGFKSCKKTIKTFEKIGMTAVHIEDQVSQKRCGHLENKELISTKEMVKKIKECVKTKKDKNFKIIARSDANAVEGMNKMIDRCKAYIETIKIINFVRQIHLTNLEIKKIRRLIVERDFLAMRTK